MIGYDSAFIGGTIALTSFKNEFDWSSYSTEEANLISENIVSVYQAGAFFGALFAYAAGHYCGRKLGLQIFSAVFLLGAGLMLGANGNRGLGLIYGGRVLAGIGVGGASNLTPIYISELAPPAIRGRLVGLYEMGWQIGGVVGFWINVSDLCVLLSEISSDMTIVWRFNYHASRPRTMDHPIRNSTHPSRSHVPRAFHDQGIPQMAHEQREANRSSEKSMLDPQALLRRYLHA
jgi:MFS family permease